MYICVCPPSGRKWWKQGRQKSGPPQTQPGAGGCSCGSRLWCILFLVYTVFCLSGSGCCVCFDFINKFPENPGNLWTKSLWVHQKRRYTKNRTPCYNLPGEVGTNEIGIWWCIVFWRIWPWLTAFAVNKCCAPPRKSLVKLTVRIQKATIPEMAHPATLCKNK